MSEKAKPPRGPRNRFLPGDQNPRRYSPQTSGIQKGGKHTVTKVRDAVLGAFDAVGGQRFIERIARSKKERHHFVELLKKIIPQATEVSGRDGGPIEMHVLSIARLGIERLDDEELDTLIRLFDKMGVGDFVGMGGGQPVPAMLPERIVGSGSTSESAP